MFVPKVRIEGLYHMQGRILVIPINGHGKFWMEPSKSRLGNAFNLNIFNVIDNM